MLSAQVAEAVGEVARAADLLHLNLPGAGAPLARHRGPGSEDAAGMLKVGGAHMNNSITTVCM
jgi:hypothetical protein